ncbi:MAG TPA: ABC transporter permease, partial [Pseudoneobacillus sp.]|nr:ABC transporter permease [Pseudoneobacillus sp.]
MPLKTLSFNQGVLFQNIRSLSWIGMIYFLVLLFLLPLQFVLAYNNERYQYNYNFKDNLFAMMEPIQIFVIFIIPVLLAVLLFRYLHIKGSADFFHSLPIKREVMYVQHVIFGLFTLTIPVLVIGIILTLFYDSLHVFNTISVPEIWNWVGVTVLFNYFVFFTSAFVAMVTGISAVHAIISYILFVLPVGVYVFSVLNLEYFLFGFSSQYYINTNIERLVPFVRAADFSRIPLTGKEALAYATITIVLAILALVIYKIRRIESAQQAIAFQNLQPFFKYGVAFCCLLMGGFYFGESQDQIEWVLFGMIAASVIGFFAAEMVLQKTWRVFKEWKRFVYFLTGIALLGFLFHLSSEKYEQNLPDLADVNRVYLG